MPEELAASWGDRPPSPARTPWVPPRARRLARRMGEKVTGLDGRRAAEVALLPGEILLLACEFLDLVQREQYWPG
eukprot:11194362-Lingulodinium_polyedra.AAC.1